jgi:hypothetical protein
MRNFISPAKDAVDIMFNKAIVCIYIYIYMYIYIYVYPVS